MAAQEQVLRTSNKAKIDQTKESSECRMCEKAEESVNCVLSECSKVAQKEYKRQLDWFEMKSHWEVCQKYWIEVVEK